MLYVMRRGLLVALYNAIQYTAGMKPALLTNAGHD